MTQLIQDLAHLRLITWMQILILQTAMLFKRLQTVFNNYYQPSPTEFWTQNFNKYLSMHTLQTCVRWHT